MSSSLYLDNAATSHPKPPSVYEGVRRTLMDVGASPGRASHRLAREASRLVSEARSLVARLLGVSDPACVLFTKNATESINLVLKGWLRSGDHVLMSSMEHNAVVRPLARLSGGGVQVEVVPCTRRGWMDPRALAVRLKPHTRLVVMAHASNVNGALQPAPDVARLCNERGVPLLLDAAQTAGIQPIHVDDWGVGMLACSGHKALLGPPGVGILTIRRDLNVSPLLEGGTGSRSEETSQPETSPDRYESGTPNGPGIAGLGEGVRFILEKGVPAIREHEISLATMLEQRLLELPGVKVYSPEVRGTGTVSFTVDGIHPGDVGTMLDEGFDIAVRTGLHCAPLAHETLGSFPHGTIRVSPGYSTTWGDLERLLGSLSTLMTLRR